MHSHSHLLSHIEWTHSLTHIYSHKAWRTLILAHRVQDTLTHILTLTRRVEDTHSHIHRVEDTLIHTFRVEEHAHYSLSHTYTQRKEGTLTRSGGHTNTHTQSGGNILSRRVRAHSLSGE